jgi:hypothetical protein
LKLFAALLIAAVATAAFAGSATQASAAKKPSNLWYRSRTTSR